jgi:hypothetical protein
VEREAPRAPNPDRSIVLTGIVQRGNEQVAFFEDIRTSQMKAARVGEAVGRGLLKQVFIDHVEYEADGQSVRIELGQSLGSAFPGPGQAGEGAGTGAGGAASAASTPLAGGGNSTLERLRKQRLEELGQ